MKFDTHAPVSITPWVPRASSLLTMATCGAPKNVKFSKACRAAPSRSPFCTPVARYRFHPHSRRRVR